MRSPSLVRSGVSVVVASLSTLLLAGCGGGDERPAALPTPNGGFTPPPPTSTSEPSTGPVGVDAAPFRDPARFATVRTAERPMPPIAGGTLTLLRDGDTAVVSDPDGDRVFVVQVRSTLVHAIALSAGDEPGRVVEGPDGVAYVALRGAGAVAVIDVARSTLRGRTSVCAAPRGLAYDASQGALHVACAGGELVTYGAGLDAAPTRTLTLDDDLRDVVITPAGLAVTRFRRAELMLLDDDGRVARRYRPLLPTGFATNVAWRTTVASDGTVLMSHQVAQTEGVSTSPGGYGRGGFGCGAGLVQGAVTTFELRGGEAVTTMLNDGVMPVDVVLSGAEGALTVASPARALWANGQQVAYEGRNGRPCAGSGERVAPAGQVVALANFGDEVLMQTRAPLTLMLPRQGRIITLDATAQGDTGHDLFHTAGRAGVACASCHPEGGDDGLTWTFHGIGARRTPDLHGGVLATAPFHWSGDLRDFRALTHEVMGARMAGGELTDAEVAGLGRWVDALPSRPTKRVDAAATRGRAVYEDPAVGCANCHTDEAVHRGLAADVGTGGTFQVPSLRGLRWRAPYMHTGCAATLDDRFDPRCGGAQHGDLTTLDATRRADLVAYLQTL